MPAMAMLHTEDPREALWKRLDELKGVEVFNNQVLLAVYQRPEKTASGLFLPDQNRDEDRFQSKVGLLVKLGPNAFQDDSGKWFAGQTFELGDWLVHRPSDGWSITIHDGEKGVLCRILDDVDIKGRAQHPDQVW